jgi:hypothetical protein
MIERLLGAALRWGSILRFALNAPPSGLRRASLQTEPQRSQNLLPRITDGKKSTKEKQRTMDEAKPGWN